MRLRVAVFSLCSAAFLFEASAWADERSDEARRVEESRRAEEARRANKGEVNEEARRMEDGRRTEQAHRLEEAHQLAPPDPTVHRPGEWKLADLQAKERGGKKLSAEEKITYEHLKAEREQRYKDLEAADRQKEQNRVARRLEAKRQVEARWRAAAQNPDVRQEFERDAQIMAQLQRAREVARADGREDAMARIDKLVQRETARHAAWLVAHGQG